MYGSRRHVDLNDRVTSVAPDGRWCDRDAAAGERERWADERITDLIRETSSLVLGHRARRRETESLRPIQGVR